jgi:hypothetical protein
MSVLKSVLRGVTRPVVSESRYLTNFAASIIRQGRNLENNRYSHQAIADHFVEVHEMVDIGSGAKRELPSY